MVETLQSPGSIFDLLLRELHAVANNGKSEWREIVEHVRTDLWETGVGAEMFVDDDELWTAIRREAKKQHQSEQLIASISRTDPGEINNLTLAEIKRLPKRKEKEQSSFMAWFTQKMESQLVKHGDERLDAPDKVAVAFANGTKKNVRMFQAAGGNPIQRMYEYYGVPEELLTDDLTVGDIGLLAVYIRQLRLLSEKMIPHAKVSVHDVPLDTLPSHVLEYKLRKIQLKAARVSGSDLGDGHIAPLLLYADAVEVDKRTLEYLGQLKRSCPMISGMIGHAFRSPDYSEIPNRCGIAN